MAIIDTFTNNNAINVLYRSEIIKTTRRIVDMNEKIPGKEMLSKKDAEFVRLRMLNGFSVSAMDNEETRLDRTKSRISIVVRW